MWCNTHQKRSLLFSEHKHERGISVHNSFRIMAFASRNGFGWNGTATPVALVPEVELAAMLKKTESKRCT